MCAEFLLRGVLGMGTPPLAAYDPDYQYAFLPDQHVRWLGNRIDYDSEGLRSDRKHTAVTAYPPRVLFVGGSVTNGGRLTSQEDTVPEVAGRWLARRKRWIVPMSASAEGWALENGWKFLEKRGLFAAKVLVLQVGSQDLWQRMTRFDVAAQGGLVQTQPPRWAIPEFATRFLLARWLRPAREGGERTAEDRRVCLETLRRMIQRGREEGCKVFVLLTPDRREVAQPELWSQEMAEIPALVSAEKATVVDTMSVLRSSGRTPEALFRDEFQPAREGNELIGETIAAVIARWMVSSI